jgi:Cdc6-like AAA superfamily ATPase
MFASRHYADLQERFQERLGEPGRQIVLYGDTGVGKTSLVRYVCETQEIKMVYVECGLRFEEMLKEALAKAGITEERFEGIDQKSTHAGVRGTLLALYAGGRHDIEDKYVTTSYPVSVQTAIREALTVEGFKVLFLDNFENLQPREYRDEVATEIVQLMKSFSDRSGGVKVVVAGIPSESEALLSLDDATGRRTAQLEVPRMPDEELDEILRKGEAKLGIEFDADCRANIIRYSDGFPYYTHLHALHAVRKAKREGEVRVGINHFMAALDSILEDADLTLKRTYADAAETTGKVKVRRSIMEAMARVEKQEVTFREIKASFWKIHPQYDNLKQLDLINPHLGELVDKYRVLQSRGLPKSADRSYRFANPLMRAYVRLMAEQNRRSTPTFEM